MRDLIWYLFLGSLSAVVFLSGALWERLRGRMEQLTNDELKALADMLLTYSELTDRIRFLKQEALGYEVSLSNLNVQIQRANNIRCFVPSRVILERVMRSIDRLPSGYREKLENLHII